MASTSGFSFDIYAVALGTIALSAVIWYISDSKKINTQFPRVSFDGLSFGEARSPSQFKISKALQEAAEKHPAQPFTVNFDDIGETTVLPMKYADDVKNNKDMSLDAGSARDFPIALPGFEALRQGHKPDHIFHDAIRMKLTQSLTFFTDDLSDEAKLALADIFPISDTWKETQIVPTLLDLVVRMTSIIFLGRDYQYIKEWQAISTSYTVNTFKAATAVQRYHPWLRPIVHWFLPDCKALRAQVKQARAIIEPEVEARREKRRQAEIDGTVVKKSLDTVDWFEDTRKGRDFDFVAAELLLVTASVHTLSATIQTVMLDLCEQPELVQALREEIISVVEEDGGLKKTTLNKMRLMDSVLRETLRLHPIEQGTLRRKVMKDVTLHDGTVIPEGTYTICGPLDNFNPEVYPNPFKFDGYRFYNLRQQPGQENKLQFVTTQPEYMAFGHGMHACPGRFFASNELKIALMHLLIKYDWKLPEGEKRPENIEAGVDTTVDPSARLMYKTRRVQEVEF